MFGKDTRYNDRRNNSRGRDTRQRGGGKGRVHDENLVDVYEDTLKFFRDNPQLIIRGIVEAYDSSEITTLTRVPKIDGQIPLEIIVKNSDTLTMALAFREEGLNPLVLNMASDFCPGGGVKRGARAQEEELFRRSFYPLPKKYYPLEKTTVIYSSSVMVCKDEKYNYLDAPVQIACIAVPAIRNPEVLISSTGIESYKNDEDNAVMRDKIHSIFEIAILYKHDSLVLGALGCGAFHNPVHDVANIFREEIDKYRDGGAFKKIGFAVLVTDGRAQPNYDVFKETMK